MSDKKISGIRALRDKLTTKAVSCAELTQAYLDAVSYTHLRAHETD